MTRNKRDDIKVTRESGNAVTNTEHQEHTGRSGWGIRKVWSPLFAVKHMGRGTLQNTECTGGCGEGRDLGHTR